MFKYKQAIVVRTDLDMGKGKLCSQVAHASLQSFLESNVRRKNIAQQWLDEGAKKVVLKVKGESQLIELFELAKREGLVAVLIRDAGKTQVEPGSITALGIGPDLEEKIDLVTGHLKLL